MMNTASRQSRSVMFGPMLSLCILVLFGTTLSAQVPVRHQEGLVHGFLALRTLQGETIADGNLIQNAHGDRVTSRLIFRFKDGSVHDEVTIFSQHGQFRLLSDHLIQKGPAFPHPIDFTINATTGKVTVRYQEDGKEKVDTKQLHVPPDVANGVLFTLLKNISPTAAETNVSYVAPTSKPRLVKLVITPQGEEQFLAAGVKQKAMHYVVKVDIGGLTGVFAELLGKKPANTEVWIVEGEAPAFVKAELPLSLGGPVWRIELASPVWPSTGDHKDKE